MEQSYFFVLKSFEILSLPCWHPCSRPHEHVKGLIIAKRFVVLFQVTMVITK